MNVEVWKDIPGYEKQYQASTRGNVRSLDRAIPHLRYGAVSVKGKPLSATETQFGYLKVSLSQQRKLRTFLVHRLIALTFLDNPLNLPEVNHKDGNKKNNQLANLEWVSRSDNRIHMFSVLGYKGFGSAHQRVECSDGRVFSSVAEAAKAIGVCRGSLHKHFQGKAKQIKGLRFRRVAA